MPNYVCEKCAHVFARKSGYDDHMRKKNDCAQRTMITAVIESKVEEKVKEVVRATMQKEITKETLPAFFEALHNLLWSQAGLNPERALEHMTFFFAYRLIEPQADTLHLPQECRWSYLASHKNENDIYETMKKGYLAFQKNKITKPFFKKPEINKASILYEIVQQISRISLAILQETDTLGDIFEYMLSRGMSTMGDDGQYFTNRVICKLAFKLAYAIKKTVRRENGSLCTFADWFCGTGGFPAEFVKGVKEIDSSVNWKKESGAVYCQDMNLSSVTTTLLNMLILTGIPFSGDTIRGSNSFTDAITMGAGAPFPGLTVDYCFMNPPYGGDKTKGKDYKFAYSKTDDGKTKKFCVNQEIQSIGIEDDDKVSAGVQLALSTLSSDGGICVLVLWAKFFFGVSKKLVELRKKIAEEYRIHSVVDIPSGSFKNTPTKTSMMVFQKGVGPTDKVTFMGLDEKVLVEVTLEELRMKNYSLNYKQYLPQSAVEVDGFEMVKLGDILDKKSSGKTKKGDMTNTGEYPFFSCTIINPCGTHSAYDHDESEYLLFAKSGGNSKQPTGDNLGIGRFYYMTEMSASTSDVSKFVLKNNRASLKYVSLVLHTKLYQIQALAKYTTSLGHIDIDQMFDEIQIPLPSLERQQEIVDSIDSFNQLAHAEEQSLKLLEKSVMFEVKWMGMGKERVKLGDILKPSSMKHHSTTDGNKTGKYPLISSALSVEYYMDTYDSEIPSLIFNTINADGNCSVHYYEKFNTTSNTYVLSCSDKITLQFIYYYLKNKEDTLRDCFEGTAKKALSRTLLQLIQIPLPSLAEQQTLQSDFDEIRHKHAKIAEYKAKAHAAIQRLIPGAKKETQMTESHSSTCHVDADGSGCTCRIRMENTIHLPPSEDEDMPAVAAVAAVAPKKMKRPSVAK